MICRHCNHHLTHVFCDLQTCPPSNAMVNSEALNHPETYFPLKVFVCEKCWLVQVDEIEKAENIFNDQYTYFSSYSASWLAHAKKFTDYMTERFGYNQDSLVVEIASNYMQWVLLAGILMLNTFPSLLLIGIILFAATTIFSIITLPVEYDASNRALAWLKNKNMLGQEEYAGAEDSLKWAARTYLVAALGSIATLLYYIMRYMGATRD